MNDDRSLEDTVPDLDFGLLPEVEYLPKPLGFMFPPTEVIILGHFWFRLSS